MGRLSGFPYREVVRRLRTFRFQFDRQGPGKPRTQVSSCKEKDLTLQNQQGWATIRKPRAED